MIYGGGGLSECDEPFVILQLTYDTFTSPRDPRAKSCLQTVARIPDDYCPVPGLHRMALTNTR